MGFVRRHRLAVELALLALAAYLAALGVSTELRSSLDDVSPAPADAAAPPAPAAPGSLADYAVIAERDIFNPPGEAGARGDGVLRLWGVGVKGREARAVIEDTATHLAPAPAGGSGRGRGPPGPGRPAPGPRGPRR